MAGETNYSRVVAVGRFKFSPALPFQSTVEIFLSSLSVQNGDKLKPILYNNEPRALGNNFGINTDIPNFVPFFSSTPGGGKLSFEGVVYSRGANPLDMLTGEMVEEIRIHPDFSNEVTLTYDPKTVYKKCKCISSNMQAVLYGDVYILAGSLVYRYSYREEDTN